MAPIACRRAIATPIGTTGEILESHHMYDQHDVETLERQFNAAMEEADTGSALEAVRRIYDEFDRGGVGLEALLHPDFQIRMETVFLEEKVYKGLRGYERWRADVEEVFEEDRFQPEGLRAAADGRWVVLGRLQITERESGDELDVPLAHVLEQRDRKVASFTVYSDISRALESVGLPA
ncbi:MAG TPA: nuclear transport factor 2 family protein [Solirubrobacterales bacterium]